MSNIATVVMTNESEVICGAVNVNTFATLLTVWMFIILSMVDMVIARLYKAMLFSIIDILLKFLLIF